MAKDQGTKDQGAKTAAERRASGPVVSGPVGRANAVNLTPGAPRPSFSPMRFWTTMVKFFGEVRTEGRRITWTSWKETWITSAMVGVMVVVTCVFFLVVDTGLSFAVQQLLAFAAG